MEAKDYGSGAIEPLASPFAASFAQFVDSVRSDCLICSPYITRGPLEMLTATLHSNSRANARVHFVTDLSLGNLVQGATDIAALSNALERLPQGRITHVPRLHAKVFVSDLPLALVGSANFTDGGAVRNLEYGFRIHEPGMIQKIRADISVYAAQGMEVTPERLSSLQTYVAEVGEETRAEQAALRQKLRVAARRLQLGQARQEESAQPSVSVEISPLTVNALFAQAILFFLTGGPLSTEALNARIHTLHPELCDDTRDRIINGKHFGKLWKHQVRGAQVFLRRKNEISYDEATKLWSLTSKSRQKS